MYKILARACYGLGLTNSFLSWDKSKSITILMGHRIGTDDVGFFKGVGESDFRQLLVVLKRHYDFITPDDVFDVLSGTKELKRKSILLTFDDGFADNYHKAFPILSELNVPAIVYIVYNSCDKNVLPWSQRLGEYLKNTTKSQFQKDFNGETLSFSLNSYQEKKSAYNTIKWKIHQWPCDEREAWVTAFGKELNVELDAPGMMNWEQILEMQEHGITFGAHTLTHPLCAEIEIEEAKMEIMQSKELLEKKIGRPVEHFAFPRGSYNDELAEFVSKRFKTFYIRRKPEQFKNDVNTPPNKLIRTGVSNGHYSETLFNVTGLNAFFLRLKYFWK